MSTKDLKLALAMLTQNAKSQFEQSQQMMSFQRDMMIQAAKAAGLELNLPELPKLEFVISADLQATIEGAEKSATDARFEAFTKLFNERLNQANLDTLKPYILAQSAAAAEIATKESNVKDAKAKVDLAKAALEKAKEELEEVETEAAGSPGAIAIANIATQILPKEYSQLLTIGVTPSMTADMSKPGMFKPVKTKAKKSTKKAEGAVEGKPEVGSGKNGFAIAFPDGHEVRGGWSELKVDSHVQALGEQGFTSWKSLAQYGSEHLRRITWRDNKNFPCKVNLKNDKGETLALAWMLNSGVDETK